MRRYDLGPENLSILLSLMLSETYAEQLICFILNIDMKFFLVLQLYKIFLLLPLSDNLAITIENINPCHPSPCGPNSQCREFNGQAVCSCLPAYTGSPPGCRPECVLSSECPQTKACVNQKCIDPCPGTCGTNTVCRVNNHSPICSCKNGFNGDPFTRCNPIPRKLYTL